MDIFRSLSQTLNEGRGAYPGDTNGLTKQTTIAANAQRRPGRIPRRHKRLSPDLGASSGRSTKAGAHTPATPCRRFLLPWICGPLNEGRGAYPGDTRIHCRLDPVLQRSTKAGAHTPATRSPRCSVPGPAPPLNEGRGAYPGDTGPHGGSPAHAGRRDRLRCAKLCESLHRTKDGHAEDEHQAGRGPAHRGHCYACFHGKG